MNFITLNLYCFKEHQNKSAITTPRMRENNHLFVKGLFFIELSNKKDKSVQFSSVQFSRSVLSDSLQPNGLRYVRPPYPLLTPKVYSNSCSLSR